MFSTALGTSGVNVMSCPPTRPVNSRNGRKLVIIFFNDAPVASCMNLDGQRCEHDRQVRLDRIPSPVKDRPCSQVSIRHPERLFDMPKVVITANHLDSRHGPCGNVRHVAFEPCQLHRPLIGLLLVRNFHKPRLLRQLVIANDRYCQVALQVQGLLITHRSLPPVLPHHSPHIRMLLSRPHGFASLLHPSRIESLHTPSG